MISMTTVSPTPYAAASFGSLRSHQPGHFPLRSAESRSFSSRHSPFSSLSHSHGFSAGAPALQSFSIGDSSDDEIPQPMHFSALTRAILEDKASARKQSPPATFQADRRDDEAQLRQSRGNTPSSRRALRISRKSSPSVEERPYSPAGATNLRSGRSEQSLRRAGSNLERRRNDQSPVHKPPQELITPAPRPRAKSALGSHNRPSSPESGSNRSILSRSNHNSSSSGARDTASTSRSNSQQPESVLTLLDGHDELNQDRTRFGVDAVPSSMRVKRVPVGSGTFLRGAPLRRGIRRRPSDDQQSPADGENFADRAAKYDSATPEHREGMDSAAGRSSNRRDIQAHDFAHQESRMPKEHGWQLDEASANRAPNDREKPASQKGSISRSNSLKVAEASQPQPYFKVPPPPPSSRSFEQGNEPPPTFKRNKAQSGLLLNTSLDRKPALKATTLEKASGQQSPRRTALAPMSSNTPARAAPPPPKMSMLETATAAGGASTVKAKKKRSHVLVNGKMFTIRGRLGRGGSSEVYKVMAENDKMFALKRVNLEECNEETVRGFKGEIDLLKKLENLDRVVRLIDWEVNSQKQTLNVLMEMGETDFNHVLGHRLHSEDSKLDLSFTRHYWREMLCCVDAVHSYDIVHSDLKPANFLLVQGRLKLIDFGIANAIDIENTVNVHRETNVGTPNYMSPESLQDTNGGERAPGSAKLMKLGKPSDVWSLGCILYQMTYGKPPFAYISNQWNRIMAIINPSVAIQYPNIGVGDVYVPSTLRRLLQRCLNRDPSQRPAIASMLSDKDTFLNPDAERDGAVPMTEELLGQILQRVVDRCRDTSRGIPSNEALKSYPKGFLDNIRASLER